MLFRSIKAELIYDGELTAPIAQGQQVGKVVYSLDDQTIAEAPLMALEPVEEGGVFKRILDWFKQLVSSWF